MQAFEAVSAQHRELETLNAEISELKGELAELRSRDALKTQFLSNISHDLRTPLTAIITHAEILQDGMLGPLNQKQDESVSGIISGGRQLLDMVSEILTYARGAANKLTLDAAEFDIKALLIELSAVHEGLLRKRSLTLDIRIPNGLQYMYGDREKVRHIINNLLGNAIEFTPPGGNVWIDVQLDTAQNEYVIEVGDTGIGIEKENFTLIFEEFSQVDSSASRQHHGTGLGLTIARRLVELHGGRIWLSSVVGAGTRLFFSIPCR